MSSSFWVNNPSVLFERSHITQLWPLPNMKSGQKLNAITRLVILLTLVGFIYSGRVAILITGIVTLAILVGLYYIQKRKDQDKEEGLLKEGFQINNESNQINKGLTLPPLNFTLPKENNPLMNVLLPEIQYDPERKPAAPAFNEEIENDINQKTIDFVGEQFDNDERIKKLLFADLADNMEFSFSMRNFNANPATTIPNDQGAFAQFCYGDMISCKEGNALACERNDFRKYPSV
jgi:hypothetical protein